MNKSVLKMNWERFRAHVDLNVFETKKLLEPFTNDPIEKIKLLSEGCANSNYKVIFKNDRPAVVLRIYVRDRDEHTFRVKNKKL